MTGNSSVGPNAPVNGRGHKFGALSHGSKGVTAILSCYVPRLDGCRNDTCNQQGVNRDKLCQTVTLTGA